MFLNWIYLQIKLINPTIRAHNHVDARFTFRPIVIRQLTVLESLFLLKMKCAKMIWDNLMYLPCLEDPCAGKYLLYKKATIDLLAKA